jgi:hypothetical protein
VFVALVVCVSQGCVFSCHSGSNCDCLITKCVCLFSCHSGSNCSSLVIFSRSLAEACSDGDVNAVRKLLDEGRSVNEHTEEGESLLCLACSAGYYELAQVCVRERAVCVCVCVSQVCNQPFRSHFSNFRERCPLFAGYVRMRFSPPQSLQHTALTPTVIGC